MEKELAAAVLRVRALESERSATSKEVLPRAQITSNTSRLIAHSVRAIPNIARNGLGPNASRTVARFFRGEA